MLNAKQMQAKQYLKQAYRCNELLKNSLEEIEILRSMSTRIASPRLTKERVTSTPSHEANFAEVVNRLVDLEKNVDAEAVHLLDLKTDIRDVVNQVEDVKGVLVLRYRYLEFMTWENLSNRMNYSMRQIHRIHEAALINVADILTEKGISA